MSTASFSDLKKELAASLGKSVLFDEPLAPYLAYAIGGPADILTFPKSESDLDVVSTLAKKYNAPITVIGTGTNLLVRDGGIRGITVSLKDAFCEIELLESQNAETIRVRAGGGVSKPDLLNWAAERGFTGLEFSSGVPGTIGGGIFMNAGTKYGCYGDILRHVRMYEFGKGAFDLETSAELFGYREQKVVRDRLVLETIFELKRGDSTAIRTEVARIIAERAAKQPLDFPSCGSTFKNPEGFSAGRLIEKANLKGLRVGNAEISQKHANFILNLGGAKASDILSLIQTVKDRVRQDFSVELECEVIILGEELR